MPDTPATDDAASDVTDEVAPPEPPPGVPFTLDGAELFAQEGELLIDAAERHGTYIPRFCYHPRMKPVGMCRMCLVEVDTGRGPALQPSCMLSVTPEMKVSTDSEVTVKAQDGVLEFLLINHPLDCPVCDKGGECPLQDQTLAYGPGESRFVEEKRHFEKPIPISDLVLLDRERCILCDRCTRFAKDVAGDAFIHFQDRGNQSQINTFPDHPFASYFSGNTVQICPVGALTSTTYRFKARPWDLQEGESTCTACSVGCRVTVQTSQDRVQRYLGVDIDPVNWGWLCDKGRFSTEAVNSDQRLGGPLVRAADALEEVTWSGALGAAASAIKGVLDTKGPRGIGVIGGARFTNESAYAWAKLAKGLIGTDNVDCQLGDGLPAALVLGTPRATIDETCTPGGTVLLMGCDPKEELPVLYLRLRHAVVEDGVTLVEVNPHSTATSHLAAHSLHPRPGELGRVAAHLAGAADGTDVGGINAGDLARVASLLATADGPVTVIVGRGSLAEGPGTTVDAVAALLEGLGTDRVRFLPALRRGNVAGALDMGLAPGMLPGRVTLAEGREAIADHWPAVPAEAGLDTVGMLQAAASGEIPVLVLLGADLFDVPDRDLVRRALSTATVVVVDLYENDTTGLADVVLPAAGPVEEDGTTTNLEGRISSVAQRVTPPGTSRAPWMIATELAWRLEAELGLESAAATWEEIVRLAPSHRDISSLVLRSPLASAGVVAPMTSDDVARHLDSLSTSVTITGVSVHGRAGVRPDEMARAATDTGDTGTDAGGAGADEDGTAGPDTDEDGTAGPDTDPADGPATVRFVAPEATTRPDPVDSYSLRLVATRRLYDQGTLTQAVPQLGALAEATTVRINPYDFDRLGAAPGEQVRVSSAKADFLCEVVSDGGVPRGCAAMVYNQANVPVAELIDAIATVNDVRVETLGGDA
jgi:NADH-quinone oxidoreductase subunit G